MGSLGLALVVFQVDWVVNDVLWNRVPPALDSEFPFAECVVQLLPLFPFSSGVVWSDSD